MSSSTQSNDEIDLKYTYIRFKKLIHAVIKSLFAAYDFVISKWYIILGLILLGLGLAYFKNQDSTIEKEAKVLLKVNYKSGQALYNAVAALSGKFNEADSLFITELGFNYEEPEVSGLELEPVINIQDLITLLDNENRSLDPLLRYVEFNLEDTELYETFATEYQYHYLKVTLSEEGDSDDILRILDYINNKSGLNTIARSKYEALTQKIEANNVLASRVDTFMLKYLNEKNVEQVAGAGYFVESDERPDLLVTSKTKLLDENLELKELVVFGDKSVVAINGLEAYPVMRSLKENPFIVYPILLVFGFLALAYLRFSFFRLRKIADAA